MRSWRLFGALSPVSVIYLVVVVTLAAVATTDTRDVNGPLLWVGIVLCLPTFIPAVPVFYVAAALSWNVSHADTTGPAWPVTMTYACLLGTLAAANVVLVRAATHRVWRHHRAHASRLT